MTTDEAVHAGSPSAWQAGLLLRTSMWPPLAWATGVTCHVRLRASSPSAPVSPTVVQGTGGFPWLGHCGSWLVCLQQDLLGCFQGAPSPESTGEERGAVIAED